MYSKKTHVIQLVLLLLLITTNSNSIIFSYITITVVKTNCKTCLLLTALSITTNTSYKLPLLQNKCMGIEYNLSTTLNYNCIHC